MPKDRNAVLRAALEGLTKAQWRRVAETVGVDVSDGELLIMRDALYDELQTNSGCVRAGKHGRRHLHDRNAVRGPTRAS